MKIKSLVSVLLSILLITAVILSAVSCDDADKELSNVQNGSEQLSLTGYFKKEKIEFDDRIKRIQTACFIGDSVYIIAYDKDYNYIVANYDLETETTEFFDNAIPKSLSNMYFDSFTASDSMFVFCTSDFDEKTFEQIYKLYFVKDGEIKAEYNLNELIELPQFGGNPILLYNGTYFYIAICYSAEIAVFSSDGTFNTSKTLPGEIVNMNVDSKGKIHVSGWDFCTAIDEKGNLDNSDNWSSVIEKLNTDDIYFGSDNTIYYRTENGIYSYDTKNESSSVVINWVNSSSLPQSGSSVHIVSDELIYLFGFDTVETEWGEYLWKYTKADPAEISERELLKITYTENGLDFIPLSAMKFNSSQDKYFVICNEISSSVNYSDDDPLFSAIDAKLLTGELGDIVELDSMDSVEKYASKNVLADYYTLMGDSIKEDIFKCVLDFCEINGKLYTLPREFALYGLAAKNKYIPDEKWNFSALKKLAESLPEDTKLFPDISRSAVSNIFIDNVISDHIDLNKGTCNFEVESFMDYLDFIASFPEEDTNPISVYGGKNCFINEQVVFYYNGFASYAEYLGTLSVFGNFDETQLLGCPSENSSSFRLQSNKYYSILESSEHKEGAAQFIKYIISAENAVRDMIGMTGFPVSKSTLEKQNESETNMYYSFHADNIGSWGASSIEEDEDIEYLISNSEIGFLVDDEFVKSFSNWLESINVSSYIPSEIPSIVKEELQAFTAGTKSAAETAKIIQDRVSRMLAESR